MEFQRAVIGLRATTEATLCGRNVVWRQFPVAEGYRPSPTSADSWSEGLLYHILDDARRDQLALRQGTFSQPLSEWANTIPIHRSGLPLGSGRFAAGTT